MRRYSLEIKANFKKLREQGHTYSEIQKILKIKFSKSTLSYWGKAIEMPITYKEKIKRLNKEHLEKVRKIAVENNKIKRKKFLKSLDQINLPLAKRVTDKEVSKIALSMLCLGEASKYSIKRRVFSLGSSDRRIIILFLEWLKLCFDFDIYKIRATVQCRADQNIEELENYWQKITSIPQKLFYKARIDPRTIGKSTKNKNYKGVLRIDYFSTKTQLELESLADLIYNQVLRARSLNG